MSFASIRTQALSLESQTVGLIGSYSACIEDLAASDEEIKSQIEQTLLKRENLIKKLGEILDKTESTSAVKAQQLSRLREVVQEHRRDVQRIAGQISEVRNRNNLLNSVRSDLEAHRNRKNRKALGDLDELDYLNNERVKADQANSVADRLIEQAYRTRDEIAHQNSVLANAGKRIAGTLGQMPGMNVLIKKIGTRRRRDSLIMAAVISFCIIVFFFLL